MALEGASCCWLVGGESEKWLLLLLGCCVVSTRGVYQVVAGRCKSLFYLSVSHADDVGVQSDDGDVRRGQWITL